MVDMIHKYKIAPAYVLGFQKDFSRRYFEEGKAVFLRNWPYVWRRLKGTPVEDKVGIVPVVHGPNGESAAALGGWNIMVGRYEGTLRQASSWPGSWAVPRLKRYRPSTRGIRRP